ncbi:MAG: hypothetical protein Kow00108_07350 [Calditrichia bacterium]
MPEQYSKYIGYSVSFIAHIILFVLFYFINVHQEPVIPEFAEVIVPAGAASYEIPAGSSESSGAVERAKLPENIELPEKMELKEDDDIPQFTPQKAIEDSKPEFLEDKRMETPAIKGETPLSGERIFERKQVPDAGLSRPSLPPLEETSTSAGTDVEKVYQIDWQGNLQREILYEVLPDVGQISGSGATVKLQFFVDADGSVVRVEPLIKGASSQLENAAIEALKKWRFNPVSSTELQQGLITFKFVSR